MHHKPLMMRAESNGNSKFVSARAPKPAHEARALPYPDGKQTTLQTSSRNSLITQLARRYPRDFTFYVADPISSIPDLWQQEAVRALQQGKDVVAGADRIGQDLHQSTSVTRDK